MRRKEMVCGESLLGTDTQDEHGICARHFPQLAPPRI